jgi:hypothetical protein
VTLLIPYFEIPFFNLFSISLIKMSNKCFNLQRIDLCCHTIMLCNHQKKFSLHYKIKCLSKLFLIIIKQCLSFEHDSHILYLKKGAQEKRKIIILQQVISLHLLLINQHARLVFIMCVSYSRTSTKIDYIWYRSFK